MTKTKNVHSIPKIRDMKRLFSNGIIARNKTNRNIKPSQYIWYVKLWIETPLCLKQEN